MTEKTQSFLEKNSVFFKVAVIGFLTIMLLIPMSMIQSLVMERKSRQLEATNEIGSKWGSEQQLVGPILSVPFFTYDLDKDKNRVNITRRTAFFLPDELNIAGEMNPEVRKRGIFKVAVYGSKIKMNGFFDAPMLDLVNPNMEIDWNNAFITLGISDMKGIGEQIKFIWNDKELKSEPGVMLGDFVKSGVTVKNLLTYDDKIDKYTFSIDITLNGSNSLSFIPVGKETNATLTSSWSNPSFDGAFLPANREVNETGFMANWKVLELNRNYPQRWYDKSINFESSSFGVSLILPVEAYQTTERSMKYSILFISLTFMVFFFVEILRKLKVHPIQYILVGFGLILFYLLLLSLSEHIGFDLAYLFASIGIVVMITSFSSSIFKSTKLSLMMGGFLVVLYGFLYILLQLQDHALLMGSFALFIILSLVMYLSRNVDWYAIGTSKD